MKIKSIQNFRDFSNMKNKDNLSIKDGLFYRCGHLNKLNKKDSLMLQKLGIKYVIDLRSDIECKEQPDKNLGNIEYVHIPILTAQAAGITQDSLSVKDLLDTVPSMDVVYKKMAEDAATEQLKKVIHFIMDADGGVAFHCTAGKDRTGLTALIILTILDFKNEDILSNYLLTNVYTKNRVKLAKIGVFLKTGRIKYVRTIHKLFIVDKSYMDAYLKCIEEKYGSLELFIKNGLCVNEEEKDKFKTKVLC